MSIIHEALKKAGEPVMTETQKTSGKKSGFQPEFLRKKQRSTWGPFVAVLVLVLIGTPVFAPLLNHRSAGNNEISVGSPLSSSSRMKQQFAVEEIPMPAIPPPSRIGSAGRMGQLSLRGLIYSEGGSFALINGTVVKPGERIGDATLVEITPNEAILDKNGERIVLTA